MENQKSVLVKKLGTVKWFNDSKGFGFITMEAPGTDMDKKDVFVHYTGILVDGFKTLPEGANVMFELIDNGRGLQAYGVEVIAPSKDGTYTSKEA